MADAVQQRGEPILMPDFDIREYIASTAAGSSNQVDMFTEYPHHPPQHSQLNMNTTVPQDNVLGSHYVAQGQTQAMTTADILNGRLKRQMKLQQMQQLQNHILQPQKDVAFNGLLTPVPSTELHAMVPKDLVSPMLLQQDMYLQNEPSLASHFSSGQNDLSMSAPAALAFQTSPPLPLPSPAEAEYDLSPLSSPWLLPLPAQQQQHQQQRQPNQRNLEYSIPRPTQRKRAASTSADDHGGMRKRLSHHGQPVPPQGRLTGLATPSASSSTSTSPVAVPAKFLSSSHDTSPVDLVMPPPAPPASGLHANVSSETSSTSMGAAASGSVSPNLAPVTPASIMNLGRLPTGLVPSQQSSQCVVDGDDIMQLKKAGKGKSVVRPKGAAATVGIALRGSRESMAKPGISPNLKPILPGAVTTSPTSPFALHPNPAKASTGHGSTNGNSVLPPGPRKTSHKAAEQKRRDSLKSSFDELRLLLPPVPLPDEASDEPPLPGSMPPRGPPKGDADGPNRSVSKLALLRCGNTYIRELQGKVSRRDTEIERLRKEVRRLRVAAGGDADASSVDLERNVDEDVSSVLPVSAAAYADDGDEDG